MIADNIRFSCFTEFYNKREFIRLIYVKMPQDYRVIYKYYIYSRRYLKERTCDAMWEFLNAACDEELFSSSCELLKEYMRYY